MIKTPLFPSEVINLEDIYVQQYIENRSKKIKQDKILNFTNDKNKIVIVGTAGSGKSCLMKMLFLDIIKDNSHLFPIFYELRKINDGQSSITDGLVKDIAIFNNKFCAGNLDYIFKREGTLDLFRKCKFSD
ncbi:MULTISPECIES: hypothetical protein [unclassified Acinetobacter]|uniref:nSTAND3 domain-containing NTPase n=1 Tax=unclassified Acinetobacter TaxID=196816 RepID=UPI0035BA4845